MAYLHYGFRGVRDEASCVRAKWRGNHFSLKLNEVVSSLTHECKMENENVRVVRWLHYIYIYMYGMNIMYDQHWQSSSFGFRGCSKRKCFHQTADAFPLQSVNAPSNKHHIGSASLPHPSRCLSMRTDQTHKMCTYFPPSLLAVGRTGCFRTPCVRSWRCKWQSSSTDCTSIARSRFRTPLCCETHLKHKPHKKKHILIRSTISIPYLIKIKRFHNTSSLNNSSLYVFHVSQHITNISDINLGAVDTPTPFMRYLARPNTIPYVIYVKRVARAKWWESRAFHTI